MSAIRAIFDGKVFVPDEPVDIPVVTAASVLPIPTDQHESIRPPNESSQKPLAELAALLDSLPHETDLPPDASINIDHYLYGHPKRTE